jgi:TonB family protein
MKVCSRCNAHYEDSMFFCLEDGTPLQLSDSPVQTNPAVFQQTLVLPTQEETPDLPVQAEPPGEKTLTLPTEAVIEMMSVETRGWQTEDIPSQPPPMTETKVNIIPPVSQPTNKQNGNGKFIAAALGGLALLGTAGGWWLLQNPSDEIASAAKVSKSAEAANQNSEASSNNFPLTFSENNSNVNNSALINANKSTPKPSPTKDKKDSPTPTQTPEPTPTAAPQTPTPTLTPKPPKTPRGLVSLKATSLIKPPYPPIAKAVRASGAVRVQVTVDEGGNVISASAISGHPLLKAAAEQAARESKFSPTILAGQPVKATGIIVYNFTP